MDKGLFALVYISIIKLFRITYNGVTEMVMCDTIPDSPAQLSVPTFYAPDSPNDHKKIIAILIGSIAGVLFGGTQCIAWSFGFPSVPEEYIWRASAIATTTIPFIFGLEIVIDATSKFCLHYVGRFLARWIAAFSIPAYCLSRAALLILPFFALRSLPPGSLLDFKWSSLIPHI